MNEFRNDIDWLTPVLALAMWAAHFSLLWAASSIFPDQPRARWIAIILTAIALGILWWRWRCSASVSVTSIPGLGIALAGGGMVFGVLPAIIG